MLIIATLDAIGHHDTLDGKDIHEGDALELEHGGEWIRVSYGHDPCTGDAWLFLPGGTSLTLDKQRMWLQWPER